MIALFLGIQAWLSRDMSSGEIPAIQAARLGSSELISLPIDTEGPYLIHFWAEWCPICKFMEESVEAISGDYPVIGIAMQSGSDEEVLAFMDEHGISYPVISDENGAISRQFGVTGVPSSFVVDKNNVVRFSERGLSSEWGLRTRLWWSN